MVALHSKLRFALSGPLIERMIVIWCVCVFFFAIPSLPQIFNDLDVQDDKLMLDLAVFLNRLVSLRSSSCLSRSVGWNKNEPKSTACCVCLAGVLLADSFTRAAVC